MGANWVRLQEVFDQACVLDEDHCRELLDRECGEDDEFRQEVLRLLHAYHAERAATREMGLAQAGRLFGAWRTIRLVGRGGMGEVWLAQRADGEHEQRAALKILSPYLAGADSIDRFRRERQLLARLEHPNIARLLDGGTTSSGESFLVMEYVDGLPLDLYCDGHRLSIRQRLELVIKACAAVNSAHQYLVLHRDLKPANILVTEEGEPKLLDFGIAKMIDSELGRERTATVNQYLTPAYASPEVLRQEPASVASDVYSLGVVLYELLTGSRPFGNAAATPIAEWERATRDTALPRPVRPTDAVAQQRSTTPDRLCQTLEGDLTTIMEKALRHEPSERYQSAEQLAEDLKRYLSNEPILARSQTWRYRAAKFIARHRAPVAIAAVLLLGIALAGVSTFIEKRIAERRFGEVRRLAHYVLFDLYDDVSNLRGSAKVRAAMARRATDYLNTLSREAKSDRGLRLELAEGYLRLGDIQGNMFRTNLGDIPGALGTYQKGLDVLSPLENDTDAVRLRTLIELHRAQAADSSSAAKADFDRLRSAVDRYEKLAGDPPSVDDDFQLGQAYTLLGSLEQQHGGWVTLSPSGGSEFDRAEKHLRRAAGAQHSDPAYAYSLAELLDRRAMSSAALQPEKSIAYDREAIDILNAVREPDRNYPSFRTLLANPHTHMVFTYGQLNQFDAALEHARIAEQIYLPLAEASPDDHDLRYRLAVLRRLTGMVESYSKKWTESAGDFAKGIADYDLLLATGPNPQYRAYRAELRMRMADDLWEAGRKQEAEAAARAGLAEFRDLTSGPGATFGLLRQAARYVLFTEVTTLRNPQEGLTLAERARNVANDPFQVYELLAAAYAENHRYREAAENERKALNELPPVKAGESPSRARQSTEASLKDYERKATALKP
jgi:non-specific serine/threonine protein kinase/serine/threonine-protein kinase